jgi:DNA-directed RNA polymerase subunit alpha
MKWKNMQIPKEVTVDPETATALYSRLVIEPLERGFGTTLGNALRRVLLSSLPGAAATALRIDGVVHEFTTVPGVYEDIPEIVLNVKRVRFRANADEPKTLLLEANRKGKLTAAQIQSDGTYEVLNKDQFICQLTGDAKFRCEIDVGVGRSYVAAEQNKRPSAPVGTVFLDSFFSPVTKVNFEIENTRVGQRTDYERLILDVWTDGSVTPDAAVNLAAKLLREHLALFVKADEELEIQPAEPEDEGVLRVRNLLKMRVDELELSVRSANCLRAEGIETLEQLVQRTEGQMLKCRNFGKKSLTELNQILGELGLKFGMDLARYYQKELVA